MGRALRSYLDSPVLLAASTVAVTWLVWHYGAGPEAAGVSGRDSCGWLNPQNCITPSLLDSMLTNGAIAGGTGGIFFYIMLTKERRLREEMEQRAKMMEERADEEREWRVAAERRAEEAREQRDSIEKELEITKKSLKEALEREQRATLERERTATSCGGSQTWRATMLGCGAAVDRSRRIVPPDSFPCHRI